MALLGRIARREDRKRRKRTIVPYQRFQRCRADVKIRREEDDEVYEGRVFLHDLTPDGVSLFVEETFSKNDQVNVVIESPRQLYLKGSIAWCDRSYTTNKIIRVDSFDPRYRIGVTFQFETDEDREAVRAYCEMLAIKRDPRVMLAEVTEQRITALSRILVNVCLGTGDGLEKCLALNPAPHELAAAFTRTKAYDTGADWYARVTQVRGELTKMLSAVLKGPKG